MKENGILRRERTMEAFEGQKLYTEEGDVGNPYRRAYLDGVLALIEKRQEEGRHRRDERFSALGEHREALRREYLAMLGQPVEAYPKTPPTATEQRMGEDALCTFYRLAIEVTEGLPFYGILMLPHAAGRLPLVIAQHGGGGTPELCSDIVGENNYTAFTKRALARGMAVFAPQLMLWKHDTEERRAAGLAFNRNTLNDRLRQVGLTFTGLEVFCLRRAIDYLVTRPEIDGERIGMMGLSYGGYFSLHTAAADTRIRSVYGAAFFNDRAKVAFTDWSYDGAAYRFMDAEVCALCAPRRLLLDVGREDTVFDYRPSQKEAERAARYYASVGAADHFRYHLYDGGHRFDVASDGFDFFFDGI